MSSKNKRIQRNTKTFPKNILIIGVITAVIAIAAVVIVVSSGGNDISNIQANVSGLVDVAGEQAVAEEIVEVQEISNDAGITILKSEITEEATFYPYQAGDTYMEVIAIRASDGTVRTAFNTCQVCQGSGRAYYEQEGDVLICQNCGNRFTVDQVEVIKGGCNPIPIFEDSKKENEETITIPSKYLEANKGIFNNWKL
jgi:hypothetical protein